MTDASTGSAKSLDRDGDPPTNLAGMDSDSGFNLAGSVALVTGSTAGIGLGIARALGRAGARVMITSRRAGAVDETVAALKVEGIQAGGRAADMRDPVQVGAVVAHVAAEAGGIDILVNCAGGSFGDLYRTGLLVDMQAADFLESYRANVISAFLCAQAAIPHLQRSGRGAIVNVASMSVYGGVAPGMGTYAAAKAGMVSLTRTMAAEWSPGVRVNAVAPGHIDTPRTTANRSDELLTRLASEIVMGRLGTPADVGWAVCYLASPASGWMTGTVIQLDGGESLS